jgi:hypothetical protein
MKFLMAVCVAGAALSCTLPATAKDKAGSGGQNMGAIRDQCRAQATGTGGGKQAQIKACIERAKSGAK